MVFMKYLLGQTGFFPQWEPRVDDVLYAATLAHEIERHKFKNRFMAHGKWYYYVIPKHYKISYLYDLTRVFRANGVILRPHKSHTFKGVVFRVPSHGQDFMRKVRIVNENIDNFQKILSEYDLQMSKADIDKIVRKAQQQSK